jgi:hypothetical protein
MKPSKEVLEMFESEEELHKFMENNRILHEQTDALKRGESKIIVCHICGGESALAPPPCPLFRRTVDCPRRCMSFNQNIREAEPLR